MLIFFAAFLYVLEMVVQYIVCSADMMRWRKYEEGRLDSDDVDRLVLRERHYRLSYDRFADELKLVYQLAVRECPFHENCRVFHKRYLARMTDFSYRCWLSLSVVVLCNFARAMFTPYSEPATDDEYFINALIYMACTGWFVLLLFGVFCLVLFRSMSDMVNKRLKRSTIGSEIVPFYDPLRATEFLQCVMLSLNYFMTVFVLGIANTITGTGRAFAVGVLFALPLLIVMAATPWVLWSLSIMSVLGSVKRNRPIMQRIVRETRGHYHDNSDEEGEDEYSDLDDDDKPQGDRVLDRMAAMRGAKPRRLASRRGLLPDSEHKQHEQTAQRPAWLDDDERWDGQHTSVAEPGNLRNDEGQFEFLFYDNVDGEEFDMVAKELAPELVRERRELERSFATQSVEGRSLQGDDGPGRTTRSSDGKGRPSWLESDEELDL